MSVGSTGRVRPAVSSKPDSQYRSKTSPQRLPEPSRKELRECYSLLLIGANASEKSAAFTMLPEVSPAAASFISPCCERRAPTRRRQQKQKRQQHPLHQLNKAIKVRSTTTTEVAGDRCKSDTESGDIFLRPQKQQRQLAKGGKRLAAEEQRRRTRSARDDYDDSLKLIVSSGSAHGSDCGLFDTVCLITNTNSRALPRRPHILLERAHFPRQLATNLPLLMLIAVGILFASPLLPVGAASRGTGDESTVVIGASRAAAALGLELLEETVLLDAAATAPSVTNSQLGEQQHLEGGEQRREASNFSEQASSMNIRAKEKSEDSILELRPRREEQAPRQQQPRSRPIANSKADARKQYQDLRLITNQEQQRRRQNNRDSTKLIHETNNRYQPTQRGRSAERQHQRQAESGASLLRVEVDAPNLVESEGDSAHSSQKSRQRRFSNDADDGDLGTSGEQEMRVGVAAERQWPNDNQRRNEHNGYWRFQRAFSGSTKLDRERLVTFWKLFKEAYPSLAEHLFSLSLRPPNNDERTFVAKLARNSKTIARLLNEADRLVRAAGRPVEPHIAPIAGGKNGGDDDNSGGRGDSPTLADELGAGSNKPAGDWLSRVIANPYYAKLVHHLQAQQEQQNQAVELARLRASQATPLRAPSSEPAHSYGRVAHYPHELSQDSAPAKTLDKLRQLSQHQHQQQQQHEHEQRPTTMSNEIFRPPSGSDSFVGLQLQLQNSDGGGELESNRILNSRPQTPGAAVAAGDSEDSHQRGHFASNANANSYGLSEADLARSRFVYGNVLLRPNQATADNQRSSSLSTLRQLSRPAHQQQTMQTSTEASEPAAATAAPAPATLAQQHQFHHHRQEQRQQQLETASESYGRVLVSPPTVSSSERLFESESSEQMAANYDHHKHRPQVGGQRQAPQIANQFAAGQSADSGLDGTQNNSGGGGSGELLSSLGSEEAVAHAPTGSAEDGNEFEGTFHSGPLQQAEGRALPTMDGDRTDSGPDSDDVVIVDDDGLSVRQHRREQPKQQQLQQQLIERISTSSSRDVFLGK